MQTGSCGVVPTIKIELEDVLDRKHLPPIGLKDFEQYLLAVERAEYLYFVLWLREYAVRYADWSAASKKCRQPSLRGGPNHAAYRINSAAESSPALAAFYARARQTFFAPGAPYELDAPSDMLAPFLSTGIPASPTPDSASDAGKRTSAYGAHPDPEVFTELSLFAHHRLRESLDRFVHAAYPNVGSKRATCGLVGGSVITLIGAVPPIAVNFAKHASRWLRLLSLPGLWLGVTIIIASFHGMCVMVYIFGDLRQLRKYEFMPPPDRPSVEPIRAARVTSEKPKLEAVLEDSTDSLAVPPPAARRARDRAPDGTMEYSRPEDRRRPTPLKVDRRASGMTLSPVSPYSTSSKHTRSTTPGASASQLERENSDAASSATAGSDASSTASAADDEREVDEDGRPVPPPQISVSGAYYDGPSATDEGHESPTETAPLPPPAHPASPLALHHALLAQQQQQYATPWPSATFIRYDLPPIDSTRPSSIEDGHYGAGDETGRDSASSFGDDVRPERVPGFDFEGLPPPVPRRRPTAYASIPWSAPPTWTGPAAASVTTSEKPTESLLPEPATSPTKSTFRQNRRDKPSAASGILNTLGGWQDRCTSSATTAANLRTMLNVPAFGAPLVEVQSPVITRAQWSIVVRSAVLAAVASIALMAGLVAIPEFH
jgi:hypothetical protein